MANVIDLETRRTPKMPFSLCELNKDERTVVVRLDQQRIPHESKGAFFRRFLTTAKLKVGGQRIAEKLGLMDDEAIEQMVAAMAFAAINETT